MEWKPVGDNQVVFFDDQEGAIGKIKAASLKAFVARATDFHQSEREALMTGYVVVAALSRLFFNVREYVD
jgi:hypothetical protein